jgi:hypothetical protein
MPGPRPNRGAGLLRRLESLRPQQCVGQVKQQSRGDEAGEGIVEDHGRVPSMRSRAVHAREPRERLKSLAGVGVADSECEEAQPKGQHDNVQHGILPVALACVTMRLPRRITVSQYVARGPGFGRISAPEVPLDAYVFEAIAAATL